MSRSQAPLGSLQMLQLGFVVLASVAVYSFVRAGMEGEQRRVCTPLCAMRPNYAAENRSAPDFELPSIDGNTVKLSDYRGRVVILNFWTKTCRPCLEEMPSLADLGAMLAGNPDVVLLTVSTDESVEDARATLGSVIAGKVPFVTLVDADAKMVRERYGTKLYPETWFIDPDGVIRARFDGPRDWSQPLTLELAESLQTPLRCAAEFSAGRARGAAADVCDDVPGAG